MEIMVICRYLVLVMKKILDLNHGGLIILKNKRDKVFAEKNYKK